MSFSQLTSFTCCDNAPLGNRDERIATLAESAHCNQKIEDDQNCFTFSEQKEDRHCTYQQNSSNFERAQRQHLNTLQ